MIQDQIVFGIGTAVDSVILWVSEQPILLSSNKRNPSWVVLVECDPITITKQADERIFVQRPEMRRHLVRKQTDRHSPASADLDMDITWKSRSNALKVLTW